MRVIAVTGATGFIGSAVCDALRSRDLSVIPLVRSAAHRLLNARVVDDIGPETNWQEALGGVTCVVHCAALVHQMKRGYTSTLQDYLRVNTEGTLRLAEEAVKVGVKRFVFISSVKVMGELSAAGHPFSVYDVPSPVDPYGVSKWEAEQRLAEVGRRTGLEVVVIRPPLVYGPGVGANFHQLMQWIRRGVPLPFGAIKNQRSFVSLSNLTDLISRCVDHPAAIGQCFFVSDGRDLSTPVLVSHLARSMGKTPRLLSVPTPVLHFLGTVFNRSDQVARLTGNLQVDIAHTQRRLAWTPACSVEAGMALVAKDL